VTAILGVTWTLVTPVFQAPDENSHFAYLQVLAERFELPGDGQRQKFSTEQTLINNASNAEQAAQQPFVRMQWSAPAYQRWRDRTARLPDAARRDGGGPNPASANPPLYYLYETPAYLLGEGGDLATRLQLARLASVLWLLITVVGVWLLAGEVFARDRVLQLAAAGTAGLAPMVGFISASLNPDAMLFALWSLALWLGARVLKRGVTPLSAGVLFATVGIACVVKATSFALLPGALLVLAIAAARLGREGWRRSVAALSFAVLGLALTIGMWVVVSRTLDRAAAAQVAEAGTAAQINLRELGSYVWQFYLPRLPFQTSALRPTEHIAAYDIWLKTAWASFGWQEVNFAGFVYIGLAGVTGIFSAAALARLWRRWRTLDRATLAFFAVVFGALLVGLHWTEYLHLKTNAGAFTSGRYLLPLVGLAGLVVAEAVSWMPPAGRAVAVATTLGGFFVLDLFSFGLVLERFYA
jgi:4-amino-4-deoxy-L-arabinose transferase-like glycosyltransferase